MSIEINDNYARRVENGLGEVKKKENILFLRNKIRDKKTNSYQREEQERMAIERYMLYLLW